MMQEFRDSDLVENRNESSISQVSTALDAFVNAGTWKESWDVLEERQMVLLSDLAFTVMRNKIAELREEGALRAVQHLEHHLQLLEVARIQGIEAAWQHLMEQLGLPSEVYEVAQALETLLNADSLDEMHRVLEEKHIALLSDTSLSMLGRIIVQQRANGNVKEVERLEEYLSLLGNARNQGIDAAWQHFEEQHHSSNTLPRAAEAFFALVSASTLDEIRQVLEERATELLSDALPPLVSNVIDTLRTEENTGIINHVERLARLLEEARANGISTAWQHFEEQFGPSPAQREAVEAIKAFFEAATMDEQRRVLEEQQSALLSEATLALVRDTTEQMRLTGGSYIGKMAEHFLHFLEEARANRISAAWDNFQEKRQELERSVVYDLVGALEPLLRANTWEEARRVLEEHRTVLLSEIAIALLRSFIAGSRASDETKTVEIVERYLDLLEEAHRHGIDAVRDRFKQTFERSDMPPELSQLVQERDSLNLPLISPRTIELLTQALMRMEPGENPHLWAQIHNLRGAIYQGISSDRRADNIEQAIADCNAALQVLRRDEDPRDWAMTLRSRGDAYQQRIRGNHDENIEQAISDYDAALQVFTHEAFPTDWATTIVHRSRAYVASIRGEPAENIEQAIADCNAALQVLRREEYPYDWATTLRSRGNAYADRILGDHRENLEQAIADYSAALTIFTPEQYPQEWVTVHQNRGLVYTRRIQGDYAENLEQAIADDDAALEVLAADEDLYVWATLRRNRGSAYLQRILGDRAENLEQAITDYNAALEVQVHKEMPHEYAAMFRSRAHAYLERILGDRAKNIEQAIADYNAALEVLIGEDLPYDRALTYGSRGIAYAVRIRGDHVQNLEQAIADYNAALEVLTAEQHPHEWATARQDRGLAYFRRVLGDRAENLEQAIVDCDAALQVHTYETTPLAWAQAHSNRSAAYSSRVQGDRKKNNEQAIADCNAALQVFTLELFPRDYRDAQINKAKALIDLGRWEEAHSTLQAAREATRLLLEMASTSISLFKTIGERADLNLYLRDAQVLLKYDPPNLEEAVIALEEGRAQNLRLALHLDAIDPENVIDPAAHARAEAFVTARDAWRKAQQNAPNPLPVGLSSREQEAEAIRHRLYLEKTHAAFTQALNAIRHEDNPDYLAPAATIEAIARAIKTPNAALVYLTAEEEGGWALVVSRQMDGAPQVQYVPLPKLTNNAVSHLFETNSYKETPEGPELCFILDKQSPSRPTPMILPLGGLWYGQMGQAFEFLRVFGNSFLEATAVLPDSSGFHAAAQWLIDAWTTNSAQRELVEQPFATLSDGQSSKLAGAFNKAVLNVELSRSLRTLGELGLCELAQMLLKQGIHNVMLIPYRRLGLIPFPPVLVRLQDGSEWRLGDLFEIAVVPNAHAAEVAYERSSKLNRTDRPLLLTVGNPQPLPKGISSLNYAETEADTIQRIARAFYPADAVRYLTSSEATKEQVVKALEHTWYAHLALHGQYDVDEPRHSRLVLAGDEHMPEAKRNIYLGETLDGTIKLAGIRLLVLSACETALIDTHSVPDEVLGLAAGFLQAGVAGVIASLWAVDDYSTHLLMSRFAQLYLDPQRGYSPAFALAEAQSWLRDLTNNDLLVYLKDMNTVQRLSPSAMVEQLPLVRNALREGKGNEHPYADPYHWAAFVYYGAV